MFIRFVSTETDESSQVAAGIFVAAYRLRCEANLPDYEDEYLHHLLCWFGENLLRPYRFSRSARQKVQARGICWFRPSATEHLRRAWEMVVILESNDVPVHMIKANRIGYVVYEDQFQVVAEPFADMHLIK